MDLNKFRSIKCGVCCEPIGEHSNVNFVELGYFATWDYPILSNLLIKDYGNRAIAIVHDHCLGKTPEFALEIRATTTVYHMVEKLEKAPIYVEISNPN